MIHKKIYIFIGTLLVCAGIASAIVFSGKNAQQDISQVSAQSVMETVTEKDIHTENEKVETPAKQTETSINSESTAISYRATQSEGTIGSYNGKQLDNPADNIFTVSVDKQLSVTDKVWLAYDLTGVADFAGIPYSINDHLSTGGYLVKAQDKTTAQRQQINPAWLTKGDNRFAFSLPEAADYGYQVSNLRLEVEKGTADNALIVNAPQTTYNNKVYLHGFIQQKEASNATFYVDGNEVTSKNGEFEALIPANESRKVMVKAVLKDGKELIKELSFVKSATANFEYALNTTTQEKDKTFRKGMEDRLELATALLEVKSSALIADAERLSITSLRSTDIAALDMGMSNVTAEHKGYRFLPHGEHFTDGAKVTIKYDRTKIPGGFTEDDIKTFYFDLESKHWVALERDTIDKKNQLIVSNTTHFTDMINGVIQTPESPETQGFAPTMMNDIKAADPTAKVQVIAPPTANNRGSAGLSYSFEMPPARNGMQPNLGVQYNSDGGAGWLGEGWDLSTPSISVDTRWGVPRYNDAEETETYSFNGSMLATMDDNGESSVAHRGDRIGRKADRQFYPRNEGSFSQIIRKGSSPSNYTWEVTDKSGTKYTYGGNNGMLKGTAKALTGDKGVIVEWKLSRVEELHGDWLEYSYETADEPVRGSLSAKALYLKEVRAGNKGENPHTVITLTSNSQKDKKTNSARYGFLTSSNKLLNKVDIAFEGKVLRSYTFEYKQGAFHTNILTKINHLDASGTLFASHDMDYYDDVKSTEGYKPFRTDAEEWILHNDKINAGFINPIEGKFNDKASALGGSKTSTLGASLYTGVGLPSGGKNFSAGVSYNYSNNTTEGLATLIDINGDGLPDKVFRKNKELYYRPNISQQTAEEVKYGDEIKIQGISRFSKTKNNAHSFGVKTYILYGSTGADKGFSSSETSVYFSDVNNDGLVDLVDNGDVFFNHITKDAHGNLVPDFTQSSGDTPGPITGGGVIDASDTEVDPQEQEALIASSPLLDAVRVWEVPYDGTVRIDGEVTLQNPTGDYDAYEYEKADGVRVAVQVKGEEKWSKTIAKGDNTPYATGITGIPVRKGDRIYFRVQSGTEQMSNGAFDQVKWSPVITYTDKINHTHPNGYESMVFKASDVQIMNVHSSNYISPDGKTTISGKLIKPLTTDDVTIKIILSNDKNISIDGQQSSNPDYREVTIYERTFAFDEVYEKDTVLPVENTIAGSHLQIMMTSSSNIAYEQISWNPVIESTINGFANKQPATISYTVYDNCLTAGVPYPLTQQADLTIKPLFSPLTGINGNLLMVVKSDSGLLAKKRFR